MLRTVPDHLNQEQLTQYLSILIEKIIEKLQHDRPELKQITTAQKKDLAQGVAKLMLQNGEFSHKDVIQNDPKFLHKLTIALVMTATLGKHENLFDSLKILFNKKGVSKEEELKIKLKPEELNKILNELNKLKDEHELGIQNLKKSKLIPQNPEPQGKKVEEFDPNIYLLGVIDPYNAGGLQAVVTQFLGNLFGIPDQNPYAQESEAQLSLPNKTSDTQFGDSLGLNHLANENFEANGSVIAEAMDEFQHQFSIQQTMKPIEG